MRGGRTEPRMVARSTYHAHARARIGPIGSYTAFAQENQMSVSSGTVPGPPASHAGSEMHPTRLRQLEEQQMMLVSTPEHMRGTHDLDDEMDVDTAAVDPNGEDLGDGQDLEDLGGVPVPQTVPLFGNNGDVSGDNPSGLENLNQNHDSVCRLQ